MEQYKIDEINEIIHSKFYLKGDHKLIKYNLVDYDDIDKFMTKHHGDWLSKIQEDNDPDHIVSNALVKDIRQQAFLIAEDLVETFS